MNRRGFIRTLFGATVATVAGCKIRTDEIVDKDLKWIEPPKLPDLDKLKAEMLQKIINPPLIVNDHNSHLFDAYQYTVAPGRIHKRKGKVYPLA